jgi:hypothetical protein
MFDKAAYFRHQGENLLETIFAKVLEVNAFNFGAKGRVERLYAQLRCSLQLADESRHIVDIAAILVIGKVVIPGARERVKLMDSTPNERYKIDRLSYIGCNINSNCR